MQATLTWEADELRAGMRKIPGYAGHVTGVQYTMGRTYGTASAEALSDDTQTGCKARHSSAVLGHRHDGYTTQGNTLVIIAVGEVYGGLVLAPASWNAAGWVPPSGSQPSSAQLVRCATTQAARVAAASAFTPLPVLLPQHARHGARP